MSSLNRKLFRNLRSMKGQSAAIALVIAGGVGMAVMSLSTLRSLRATQETYYDRYRFADIHAAFRQGPMSLTQQIAAIPGVASVEGRIVRDVSLIVEGLPEPAVGRLISVPDSGRPILNQLHLRQGRLPEPGRLEVLAGESFAVAHGFQPGAEVRAVMNGRLRTLRIVGIALSPEYIVEIGAGDVLPDFKRFGIFWMPQVEMEAVFDMQGGCNNVAVSLMHGASSDDVIRRMDDLLGPWGGVGSYDRSDQLSHRFITDEINQLKAMGLVTPVIFMSVASFLLNIVMKRMIDTQREQIAALKAFGYYNSEITLHYLKLVGVIVAVGLVLGIAFGVRLGHGLTAMYTEFFHFPIFRFEFDRLTTLLAAAACGAAAFAGTWVALRSATGLPPAEAMRPPSPGVYRQSLPERLGLQRIMPATWRMIFRQIRRRPVKSTLSVLGIATAASVMVLGNYGLDALQFIIDFQFLQVQRQDLQVMLSEASSEDVRHDLAQLPGVIRLESFRSVPVRVRAGARSYRTAVMGMESHREIFRVMAEDGSQPTLREDGLVLSATLAARMDVLPGDELIVEVLEGRRPVRTVIVVDTVDDMSGTNAYALKSFADRLVGDGDRISGAWMTADASQTAELYRRLKATPAVVGVSVKKASIDSFMETIGKNQNQMQAFVISFAVLIAAGVVYNTARISLAERDRELATMRVLGFTTNEISVVLLGELAVLTLLSLPVGMLLGYGMAWLASLSIHTDVFRIPLVVLPATYGKATIVVLASALISGLIVRQRLKRLDLFAVLKGTE